jgi:hypothetical protein
MKSILLAALVLFSVSLAQAQTRTCQLVQELSLELGCGLSPNGSGIPVANGTVNGGIDNSKDFLVTSAFGPTQCKTEAIAKEAVKDLKSECNTWIKERKNDLGAKFLTGTCNDSCTDCTMGLKRCQVNGLVHYAR